MLQYRPLAPIHVSFEANIPIPSSSYTLLVFKKPLGSGNSPSKVSDDGTEHKRRAELLDSLASLLVFQGQGQVIAVGATPPQQSGTGPRIFVAENGDVSNK
jgi:hypothetical protein